MPKWCCKWCLEDVDLVDEKGVCPNCRRVEAEDKDANMTPVQLMQEVRTLRQRVKDLEEELTKTQLALTIAAARSGPA